MSGNTPFKHQQMRSLPQTTATWQVEHRKLDIPGSKAGRQGKKAHILFVLDVTNEKLVGLFPSEVNPTPKDVKEALWQAMTEPEQETQQQPSRPRQVNFTNPDWLRSLSADLWAIDVATGSAGPSEMIDQVMPELEEALKGGLVSNEAADRFFEVLTSSPQTLGDLYQAAAQFIQNGVSESFGPLAMLRVEIAGQPESLYLQFIPKTDFFSPVTQQGLVITPNWDDLLGIFRKNMDDIAGEEELDYKPVDGMFTLVFTDKSSLPKEEIQAAKKHHWQLPAPNIYPQVITFKDHQAQPLNGEQMRLVTALLRGVVQLTRQAGLQPYMPPPEPFDETITIQVGDSEYQLTFYYPAGDLPDFLTELLDDRPEDEGFDDDIEDDFDDDPMMTSESLEEAAALAEEAANQEDDAEAVRIAHQAIATDADHPLAYLVLEQRAKDRQTRKQWINKGLQAMQRLMERADPRQLTYFEETMMAHESGLIYFDLLTDQADTAIEEHDLDTAQAAYQRLLEIDPEDTNGIRYFMADLLLRRGQNQPAIELLDEYEDDFGLGENYLRALALFRLEGNSKQARKALKQAVKDAPEIADYLAARKPMPMPSISLAEDEEDDDEDDELDFWDGEDEDEDYEAQAVKFVQQYFQVFYSTPGLIDWLKKHAK